MKVTRFVFPNQIENIAELVQKFHERVRYLPYPMSWTISTMASTVGRWDFLLIAAENETGYKGYIWAQALPSGELFIYQAYSESRDASEAMNDYLNRFSRMVGVTRHQGMVRLSGGEQELVAEVVPRLKAFKKKYGFVPVSVLIERGTDINGH